MTDKAFKPGGVGRFAQQVAADREELRRLRIENQRLTTEIAVLRATKRRPREPRTKRSEAVACAR